MATTPTTDTAATVAVEEAGAGETTATTMLLHLTHLAHLNQNHPTVRIKLAPPIAGRLKTRLGAPASGRVRRRVLRRVTLLRRLVEVQGTLIGMQEGINTTRRSLDHPAGTGGRRIFQRMVVAAAGSAQMRLRVVVGTNLPASAGRGGDR